MVHRALFLIIAMGTIASADTGFYSTINVTETDHSPQCQVGQIQFSTGTVSCQGQVAVVKSGAGSPFTSCGSNPSGLQFTDVNQCTWCETINTSGVLITSLISCLPSGFMLLEDGTFILQEDGSKILTE